MTNSPTVSVITWDGGFRENYHTVDFFCKQTIDSIEFEFLWLEYYSSIKAELAEKINQYSNARTICLGNEGDWHVAKCMNKGIKLSKGEHLILIDGDIAVSESFIEKDRLIHNQFPGSAVYYRRMDEPSRNGLDLKNEINLEYLKTNCILANPTNYGGCLSISKNSFEKVCGYEEHSLFSGNGAVSKELYIRLRNAGIPILWHPTGEVYHPWHDGTIPSNKTTKRELQDLIINLRELELDTLPNQLQINNYMKKISSNELKDNKWEMLVNIFKAK